MHHKDATTTSSSIYFGLFECLVFRTDDNEEQDPLEVARDRNYLAASDMHAVQRMVHGAPSGRIHWCGWYKRS